MAQYSSTGHMNMDSEGGDNYTSITLPNTREPNSIQALTTQSKIQPADVSLLEATGSLKDLDLDETLGSTSGPASRKNKNNRHSRSFGPDYEDQCESQQENKLADEIPRSEKVEIQLVLLSTSTALLTY